MKYSFFLSLSVFITLLSCDKKEKTTQPAVKLVPIERLIVTGDSVSLGNKKDIKVEIIHSADSSKFKIRLYKKTNDQWLQIQTIIDDNEVFPTPKIHFKDFNNDGLKDLLVFIGTGAKGGNAFYNLYLFDPTASKLKFIKGSDFHPNLNYNKRMNCLDSFGLTAGSETVFLRIKNDSIVPFAGISIFPHSENNVILEKYIIDEKGKHKTIFSSPTKLDAYTRFLDFNTLEVNNKNNLIE